MGYETLVNSVEHSRIITTKSLDAMALELSGPNPYSNLTDVSSWEILQRSFEIEEIGMLSEGAHIIEIRSNWEWRKNYYMEESLRDLTKVLSKNLVDTCDPLEIRVEVFGEEMGDFKKYVYRADGVRLYDGVVTYPQLEAEDLEKAEAV